MAAAQELENLQEKMNWHWRNSMRVVRFFAFDARAAAPLPVLLIYFRMSTLTIMILSLLLFRFLENKGLTVPAAVRNFRSWLVGSERSGWYSAQKRTLIDYG